MWGFQFTEKKIWSNIFIPILYHWVCPLIYCSWSHHRISEPPRGAGLGRPLPDVGAGAAPHPASPAGDKTVPLAASELCLAKINMHFHVFK